MAAGLHRRRLRADDDPLIGPLLYLIMLVGYLVFLALPGTKGPNRFGPDPLDPAQAEVFA